MFKCIFKLSEYLLLTKVSCGMLIPKIDVLYWREIWIPQVRWRRAVNIVGLEWPQLRVGIPPRVAHSLRCWHIAAGAHDAHHGRSADSVTVNRIAYKTTSYYRRCKYIFSIKFETKHHLIGLISLLNIDQIITFSIFPSSTAWLQTFE